MRRERFAIFALVAVFAAILAGCATTTGDNVKLKKEDAATKREEAARVHTELGQKYMQRGQLKQALDDLQKALQFDPDYADAHTVIAVLYENINDLKEAEEHYRRAVEIRPKSGSENNNYAAFLCKIGRYGDANKYFDRALADPFYQTPEVALTNAGTCAMHAGKYDDADRYLRVALEHNPDDTEALFQLATVLYHKGDYFHARAFIQRFESLGKPRPESLMLARNIEIKLGDAKGAQDYTRRLREQFPESQEARSLDASDPS